MSFILLGILNSQVSAVGGGSYELIQSQILSASQASITFDSIPGTYKHLQIRAVARSARADNNRTPLRITLNGDTGSNYSYHSLWGTGSIVQGDSGTSSAFMQVAYMIPDNDSGLANNFGAGIIDILDYTNTNKNTSIISFGGNKSRFNQDVQLDSGSWRNTAVVTSVNLYAANGFNFVSGSRFSIYGIKG